MMQGLEHLQTVWKWKSDKRYYIVRIQKNLFEEWPLFKEWGGLKSRAGRLVSYTYCQHGQALTEVKNIGNRRVRRGYILV